MPAYHLRKPFMPEQLQKIASEMERRRVALGADIVVVRGLSGIMVATAMSLLYKTPIAVVRKPTENSHGNSVELVEYGDGASVVVYNNWMIVDDLIDSGKTVKEIFEAFKWIGNGNCVAIALYDKDDPSVGTYTIAGVEIPVFQIGNLT